MCFNADWDNNAFKCLEYLHMLEELQQSSEEKVPPARSIKMVHPLNTAGQPFLVNAATHSKHHGYNQPALACWTSLAYLIVPLGVLGINEPLAMHWTPVTYRTLILWSSPWRSMIGASTFALNLCRLSGFLHDSLLNMVVTADMSLTHFTSYTLGVNCLLTRSVHLETTLHMVLHSHHTVHFTYHTAHHLWNSPTPLTRWKL